MELIKLIELGERLAKLEGKMEAYVSMMEKALTKCEESLVISKSLQNSTHTFVMNGHTNGAMPETIGGDNGQENLADSIDRGVALEETFGELMGLSGTRDVTKEGQEK